MGAGPGLLRGWVKGSESSLHSHPSTRDGTWRRSHLGTPRPSAGLALGDCNSVIDCPIPRSRPPQRPAARPWDSGPSTARPLRHGEARLFPLSLPAPCDTLEVPNPHLPEFSQAACAVPRSSSMGKCHGRNAATTFLEFVGPKEFRFGLIRHALGGVWHLQRVFLHEVFPSSLHQLIPIRL